MMEHIAHVWEQNAVLRSRARNSGSLFVWHGDALLVNKTCLEENIDVLLPLAPVGSTIPLKDAQMVEPWVLLVYFAVVFL